MKRSKTLGVDEIYCVRVNDVCDERMEYTHERTEREDDPDGSAIHGYAYW